ncbi:MAG: hypothetical protein AB1698_02365 [Pseudomonadota bacterium]
MILNERRLLALACVFFLLVKSLWVLLPVQAMGLPRLGDDGLVYLWTGAGTVLNPQVDTPAVQDIVALRQLKDGGDDALDFLRARTTMRVTYVAASPFAMLTGLLVHSGLSHKAAFAGAELIVAIVLAAGIASLGTALFGALGAAVALVVLAFAILPLQGIHYLIPGVLALALALLQLGELCRDRPRPLLLGALTLLIGLTHTIGVVYIALCLAFALLLPAVRRRAIVVEWTTLGAIVLGAVAAFAFVRLAGGQAPQTSGTGALSLVGVPRNLAAALGFVGQSMASQPMTWILGCLGLAWAVRHRRVEPLVLAVLILGLFLASSLFDITGYSGDLGARVLVLAMIVLAGAAGYALARLWRVSRVLAGMAIVLLVAQVSIQARATWDLLVENMNSRGEIYDEAAIRADLAALPPDAAIIWTEPDISMMAAFLEGGTRFHALPYPLIERSPERDALIARWKPEYIAAPISKVFNTTARASGVRFSGRRYGVDFSDFRAVQVRLGGTVTDRFFLRVSSPSAGRDVALSVHNGGASCAPRVEDVLTLHDKLWLPVNVTGCSPQAIVTIRSDTPGLSILGLSFGAPRDRVNWPWGSSALVLAEARRTGDPDVGLVFHWRSLLGASLARDAQPEVLSDESGIVWLKTDIASRLAKPDNAPAPR